MRFSCRALSLALVAAAGLSAQASDLSLLKLVSGIRSTDTFGIPQDSPSDRISDDIPPLTELQVPQSPLVAPSIFGADRSAEVTEDGLFIPGLITPTTSIEQIGNQRVPSDIGGEQLANLIALPETAAERSDAWSLTAYFWQAPNTYSHPLYFEDVMLERHGVVRFAALQPAISGARFFATFPLLPYKATLHKPCECYYHLGYFRPGSCAPGLLQRPPWDLRAAVVETGAVASGILLIP